VLDLAKLLDSGPPPQVILVNPRMGEESSEEFVTAEAQISDRGGSIGRIEWRVNGVTVAVAVTPRGSGPGFAVTQQLALDPGENTIEVVAYNGRNLLASPPGRTTIKFTGPAGKASSASGRSVLP
jgi:hypothetical protein